MCAREFAAMGLYAREYNMGSSKVAPSGSCEGNRLSRLSKLVAATQLAAVYIYKKKYITAATYTTAWDPLN